MIQYSAVDRIVEVKEGSLTIIVATTGMLEKNYVQKETQCWLYN
jgi:hypothetical protein